MYGRRGCRGRIGQDSRGSRGNRGSFARRGRGQSLGVRFGLACDSQVRHWDRLGSEGYMLESAE